MEAEKLRGLGLSNLAHRRRRGNPRQWQELFVTNRPTNPFVIFRNGGSLARATSQLIFFELCCGNKHQWQVRKNQRAQVSQLTSSSERPSYHAEQLHAGLLRISGVGNVEGTSRAKSSRIGRTTWPVFHIFPRQRCKSLGE
jgi:hypothetical protein